MGALDEPHLESRGLSTILAFRTLLELIDSALPLLKDFSVLFSEFHSAVTVNLLSLASETLALHDHIVHVSHNAFVLVIDLLIKLCSVFFGLLLLLKLKFTLLGLPLSFSSFLFCFLLC
jgi:hypothetical protein